MRPQLLPIDHIRQETSVSCLPACCQMVLAYHGIDVSQKRIGRLLKITPMGIPYTRIKRLERLGVRINLDSGEEHVIRNAIDARYPLILFIKTGELSYWNEDSQHAIVVVGYDDYSFYVNDPILDVGERPIPIDELMLAWVEYSYEYAQIFPR